ncbi:glycine cleavage system aminomethyltransferase GcvT [Vallitalea okinawensis]|uniref:glycine cleavage system aminomethyltransferase GcvT n=1 Tax=Vallitalea okinawensis TaxID=2078660 RepID=UPI000CFDDA4A|nr:glycine cleavage system aminomethyltransferase GcvT [Vallitalea okinawensis]
MDNTKRTFLYEKHLEHGGKMIDFAGWALPVQYKGLIEEHDAVRQAAGLFDVSHMGEVSVIGKEAEKFVNYLVTNDVEPMVNGQVIYTPMCNEKGGVVDDLLVYKFNTQEYLLVINASNTEKDYEWMQGLSKDFDIKLENISDNYAQIALQGPKAEEILQPLTDLNLSELTFYTFKDETTIAGKKVLVSRTGYTGEDGFEIYANSKEAPQLWSAIMEQGKDKGLLPAGLGARDTLRFEASLPLYGNELTDNITPLEAGLGMFVKLYKDDFVGKEVLAKQKEVGLKRKVIGFELTKKSITRHGYPILDSEGNKIGEVTTGYYLPSIDKSIGMGLVDIDHAKLGTEISIQVRKKTVDAVVRSKRFMEKKYKK